jgi:hypothetical protein
MRVRDEKETNEIYQKLEVKKYEAEFEELLDKGLEISVLESVLQDDVSNNKWEACFNIIYKRAPVNNHYFELFENYVVSGQDMKKRTDVLNYLLDNYENKIKPLLNHVVKNEGELFLNFCNTLTTDRAEKIISQIDDGLFKTLLVGFTHKYHPWMWLEFETKKYNYFESANNNIQVCNYTDFIKDNSIVPVKFKRGERIEYIVSLPVKVKHYFLNVISETQDYVEGLGVWITEWCRFLELIDLGRESEKNLSKFIPFFGFKTALVDDYYGADLSLKLEELDNKLTRLKDYETSFQWMDKEFVTSNTTSRVKRINHDYYYYPRRVNMNWCKETPNYSLLFYNEEKDICINLSAQLLIKIKN